MKRTSEERRAFVAQCALQMGADPTEGESALYAIVEPLGFKRQQVIVGQTKNGGWWFYVADAYHERLKLIVEADGGVHARTKGRDRRRDTRLLGIGVRTLRLKNRDILSRDGNDARFIITGVMESLGVSA